MAFIASNPVVSGFRGKLGDALVFRTLRGKTFVSTPARKPDKHKETEAQRSTRVSFKQAAEWAQGILLDPEQKTYYQKKAKTLKLPNAYTAALTDYMRKANVTKQQHRNTITYTIAKPGFALKQVHVVSKEGEIPPNVTLHQHEKCWRIRYSMTKEATHEFMFVITDHIGRTMEYRDE